METKILSSKKMKNKMITVGGIHNSANTRNNDKKITPASCCNIETIRTNKSRTATLINIAIGNKLSDLMRIEYFMCINKIGGGN